VNTLRQRRTLFIGISIAAAGVGVHLATSTAKAADSFAIQPEVGATEFAPGDRISITSLHGNEEHLAHGGHYAIDGTYTLSSADNAELAWFSTSRGPGNPTPIRDSEHVEVSRGAGNFHLEKSLNDDGWFHLTFYVDGHPHGGIYFGEKGFGDTVLRRKNWTDFPSPQSDGGTSANSDIGGSTRSQPDDRGNRAIMAFLGDPVPAPVTLDPRYTPSNLKAAFNTLSSKLGLTVSRLGVDDSEFPYVLFGLVAGRCDYHALADGLRQMEGYDYGGSVTGGGPGGGTNFAIDIIPEGQLPKDRAGDCRRRLMIRLQMLADSVARGEGSVSPK
jgi:hypothetical protein